jgi:apolipoprotein N-acyltransferase
MQRPYPQSGKTASPDSAAAPPLDIGHSSPSHPPFRIPHSAFRVLSVLCFAFLLSSAFPPFGYAESAWAALIPLLLLARSCRPSQAFRWGTGAGALFWLANLSWLLALSKTGAPWPLAALGWILLAGYCSLYIGLFTMTVAWISRGAATLPVMLRGLVIVVTAPLIWVGLEYARSTWFTGFAWNALGVSQYSNLGVVQLAAWGGVYAVSALIVMVNAAFTFLLLRFVAVITREDRSRISLEMLVALLVWVSCMSVGVRAVRETDRRMQNGRNVVVAALQPNIPQLKKWPQDFARRIYERLETQTRLAAIQAPALIVWPETATPGAIGMQPHTAEFIAQLAMLGSPVLAGVMEERDINDEIVLYNSSFLFDAQGDVIDTYRKIHLVPFGEYLPFENRIRFLKRFAPLGFSCLPGETMTVFELPLAGKTNEVLRFSTLICFEDTVAALARKAVRGGARLLVNQTNDAWFDGTAGAEQHMTHSVLRAIETRVPVVRAANTGVTAFIDPVGRISHLASAPGTLYAHKTDRIRVPDASQPLSPYTRHGDLPFAIPCTIATAFLIAFIVYDERRRVRREGCGSGAQG